ncbi:haloacid dehalogenase [Sorangium cellulosum]|uniref:Haloacid dehalogenase n=1 Tax=Sorangium cellulosum TaxID=56 RepID=A0A2L0ERI0_SORCE|nr:HAD-IA family hydrolase [Sorangium cellulosum]AUX41885.1 haloacid dehalogenase [Sorangium cellulosum]
MVRAVCFDLMDTVLYDPYREALAAATRARAAELAKYRDPTCWPDFEIGAIDEAEFARRFFREGAEGVSFDIGAFHRVRREGYRFLPGMREILEALSGRALRFVASNYPVWVEELRATFALDGLFEGIYSSHHLRVRKPAREFFDRLVSRIGVDAGGCLFIDDRAENCDAAAAVGMRAHLFDGAAGLRDRLVREGLLDP